MCGIIAILSRPSTRPTPDASELLELLDRAVAEPSLAAAASLAARCDHLLHGVPGVAALVGRHELVAGITARLDQLDARAEGHERWIEASPELGADAIEEANAELIAMRDAVWAVRHDRIRTTGTTGGIAPGVKLTPWIRYAGQTTFQQGKATITVQSDGAFRWSRQIRKSKDLTGYVSYNDTKSNEVVWVRIR